MTFQAKIEQIKAVLTGISDLPVGHYDYAGEAETYCVWAEDSEPGSVEGDNFKLEQTIQGTIDLFTKTEYSPFVDAIQTALKAAKISFYLNLVQYEDETELIHYEWVWNV